MSQAAMLELAQNPVSGGAGYSMLFVQCWTLKFHPTQPGRSGKLIGMEKQSSKPGYG